MAAVETLTGPVEADRLGIVAMREHLLYGRHGWRFAPEAKFDRARAFESILAELEAFKELGGRTLIVAPKGDAGAIDDRDAGCFRELLVEGDATPQ